MKPLLFSFDLPGLGRVEFPAYFTLLFLGFLVAIWFTQREFRRRGIDPIHAVDLGMVALITGLLGARLLHIVADGYFWNYVYTCTDPTLVDWGYSRAECGAIGWKWLPEVSRCTPPEADCLFALKVWKGGLAYYGGLLLAVPSCLYFLSRRKVPLADGADAAGIAIILGLIFGRLGCFLAGCCFGQVCDLPWAVSFPAGSEASKHQAQLGEQVSAVFPELSAHVPHSKGVASLLVHPTQLYEAGACVLIVLFLAFWLRPRQQWRGQLFFASLFLYGIARFLVEFLRDDDRGLWSFGLSTSQYIAIPAVALSGLFLFLGKARFPAFVLPEKPFTSPQK
jgi:phosphatidylglycerol:prolipoprotein diacylglycerol transferase